MYEFCLSWKCVTCWVVDSNLSCTPDMGGYPHLVSAIRSGTQCYGRCVVGMAYLPVMSHVHPFGYVHQLHQWFSISK